MEPDTAFQLFDRFEGSLHLRLILQPCIAAIFGYLDGVNPNYAPRMSNNRVAVAQSFEIA